MMKNTLSILTVILLLLSACTKTDDHLRALISEEGGLSNPGNIQLRNIAWNEIFSAWCGEIHTSSRAGVDNGWIPFIITIRDGRRPYVTIISEDLSLEDRVLYESILEMHQLYCSDAEPAPAYVPAWSEKAG